MLLGNLFYSKYWKIPIKEFAKDFMCELVYVSSHQMWVSVLILPLIYQHMTMHSNYNNFWRCKSIQRDLLYTLTFVATICLSLHSMLDHVLKASNQKPLCTKRFTIVQFFKREIHKVLDKTIYKREIIPGRHCMMKFNFLLLC